MSGKLSLPTFFTPKCKGEDVMDKIKIENLEVFANHGVFPEENKLGQKFLVSVVLYVDTR